MTMLSILKKSFSTSRLNLLKFKYLCTKVSPISTSTVSVSPTKQIGTWLAVMSGMTVGAVILGGVTRLTESGLSMTDWHLFKERPPLNENEWLLEFEKYKQFPEYKYVASEKGSFELLDFQFIWWMEYAHRMWGRAIGVAFALPATYFLMKGFFNKAMKIRVLIFGSLIGFQGLLGWYMVQSGLKEVKDSNTVPRVSQYRLAAHLGSAIALYSLFLWNSFSHLTTPIPVKEFPQLKAIRGATHGLKLLVVITALSGALVAGLDAGLIYNNWPKMANRWVPEEIFQKKPAWLNMFENPATVQFDHRWLGHATGLTALVLWLLCYRHRSRLPRRVQIAAHSVGAAVIAQILLGITTLVHYVPTAIAATHQTGSLVLLSTVLWLSHSLRRLPK